MAQAQVIPIVLFNHLPKLRAAQRLKVGGGKRIKILEETSQGHENINHTVSSCLTRAQRV